MIKLCDLSEIEPDTSKGFELETGEALFVVEHDGAYFCYRNKCPHLGVELNYEEDRFLDMEGALIQCSTHAALFLINSGECVAGPCQGKFLEPIAYQVKDQALYISISPS